MNELLDVLNKHGIKEGEALSNSEIHSNGHWHACIHIWLFNAEKNVLIQKRSENKLAFPSKWDVSVAGHVSSKESYLKSAIRETKEELGLSLNLEKLIFLGSFKTDFYHSKNYIDRELNYVFTCEITLDVDTLDLQKEEVSKAKFISLNKLKELIHSKNKFVPYPKSYINWVSDEIKHL